MSKDASPSVAGTEMCGIVSFIRPHNTMFCSDLFELPLKKNVSWEDFLKNLFGQQVQKCYEIKIFYLV